MPTTFGMTYKLARDGLVAWVDASQPMHDADVELLRSYVPEAERMSETGDFIDVVKNLIYLFHMAQNGIDLKLRGEPWQSEIEI